MARAVNVCVVTVFGFVFDVSGVNRNTASFFFRSCVDLVVGFGFTAELLGKNGCDSGCKGCLTMVNVTDVSNVYMGLSTFVLFFCTIFNP